MLLYRLNSIIHYFYKKIYYKVTHLWLFSSYLLVLLATISKTSEGSLEYKCEERVDNVYHSIVCGYVAPDDDALGTLITYMDCARWRWAWDEGEYEGECEMKVSMRRVWDRDECEIEMSVR